jgi:hypothetical protein
VGKPEWKRPLGRQRRRWVDNIRMDLAEVGWSDVDWIGLAQDRNRWRALVNSVLNLRVPWNAGKLSSDLTSSGLSSSAQLHRVNLFIRFDVLIIMKHVVFCNVTTNDLRVYWPLKIWCGFVSRGSGFYDVLSYTSNNITFLYVCTSLLKREAEILRTTEKSHSISL